jgi:ketosteroid isomerase-like protein
MTPGNADLVRPIYEEWGRGNWRPRFDVYDQHGVGLVRRVPRARGRLRGPRGPKPRLRAWLNGWEDWRAEADDFLEIGDYVIVLASYYGRGKGSGVEIRQEGAHVFKLRDGKVIRLEIFATRAKAIESVRAAAGAPRAHAETPQRQAKLGS